MYGYFGWWVVCNVCMCVCIETTFVYINKKYRKTDRKREKKKERHRETFYSVKSGPCAFYLSARAAAVASSHS